MREHVLILPNLYNDGTEVANEVHETAENAILSTFGGFTLVNDNAQGVWRDESDGTVYRDSVRVYAISTGCTFTFQTTAEHLCRLYCQVCVYVRYPDGTTDLIYDTVSAEAAVDSEVTL